MKIYYDADLDKRSFEGRTAIASKLKFFLEQQGYEFTNKVKDADLIHIHSSGIGKSYLAYKLKKKYKVPCIYSLYSNCETEPINHIRNFILQRKVLEKGATNGLLSYSAVLPLRWRGLFLKKLDKVIVPSDYLKNKLFKKNTEVIKFGIDMEKFRPAAKTLTTEKNKNREKKNEKTNKIKVAFFGHPGVFKGQTDFILASKYFKKNIKPFMFFTQRSNKTDRYIQKINPNINIRGYTENIVNAYNEMDIIVLPYRNPLGAIANPLILLEAMSCGKPVITTNMPFLKEIVRNAVVTVPPYNHKKIAKAVNWLAENEEAKAILGKRAREIIVNNYNEKNMLKKYLHLYQEFEAQRG